MIEETARVLRTEAGHAWVEVERKSACGSCSVSSGCGTASIARYLGRKGRMRLRALDPVGVRPGDRVVIGLEEGPMMRGMIRVYALPLAALLLGALGGELVVRSLALEVRDLGALLGGALGFLGGLYEVRRFSRRVASDDRYQPVILRRMDVSVPVVMADMRAGTHSR